MNKKGPILLIEENEEDRLLFSKVFSEFGLKNTMLCFDTLAEAEQYVISQEIKPFLLFSNVLQLHQSGKQSNYKKHKNLGLKLKCPCLFFSTAFNHSFVIDAYSNPIQSYFVTPYNEDKFKQVIVSIIEYWHNKKTILPYKKNNEFKHLHI